MPRQELTADHIFEAAPDLYSEEKADEKYARLALHLHITHRNPEVAIEWNCGANPPDYVLEVGSDRFAVEITQASLDLNIGGRKRSESALAAAAERICDQVREKALANGVCRGTYTIEFDEPFDELYKRWGEIVSKAVKFISEHDATHSRVCDFLSYPPGPRVVIKFLGPEPRSDLVVAELFDGAGGGWEGEILDQIREFLPRCLDNKARKMKNVPAPWVLVLLDRFHVGDTEQYIEVMKEIPSASRFFATYLIKSPGVANLIGGAELCAIG